jgi:plastocyanin
MSATVPDPVIVAHRLIAVLVALVLAAATMVFGAPSTQAVAAEKAGKASGPSDATVSITDTMTPAHLSVAPGDTVTWVNNDTRTHRVVSDRGASVEFDSGVLEPGERWSRTFKSAGDVTYHDHDNASNPAYFGMVMVERDSSAGSGTSAVGTGSGAFATNTASFASSSAAPQAAAAVGPKQVFVEIHNKNEFRPGNVTVAKGGTVTWFNDHSDDHTATGAGGINSGRLHRDQRYSKTFDTPGIYDYVCAYHDRMKAKVTVLRADGSEPPPPPPGGGGGTPPPPGANNKTVSITSTFNPGSVTVPVGGSVTWTNDDSSPHTATGTAFDSGNLNNGQTFTKKFTTAGTFTYVCAYHSDMTGTVKVANGSGDVPPPPPGGGGGGGGGGGNPPPPPGDGGGSPPPPPPGGGGGGGGGQAPAQASVTIDDDFFSPKAVTIRAGGKVTWTNRGNPHTATGTAFDSGNLNTGQSFTHRFPKAGTYDYVCAYHSDMTGTIKVTNASGGVPPGGDGPPGGGGGNGGGTGGGTGGGGGGGTGGGGGGGTGGGGGGGSSPSAQTHTVTMGTGSFSPSSLSARVGDTVVWKNASPLPHNVNGGAAFKSPTVMGGQSFETVLRQQGTVSYKCDFHSGMTGTIKVGAAPAGTELPPPSAGGGLSGGGSSGSMGSTGAGSSSGSSSGGSAGAPAPGAESHTISMVNSAFDPQVLQARVGDEVTWVNDDPIPHNVTGGPLDSGMMMGGAEFTTVLTEAGTIEYECTLHPGMTGTLEVAEALPGTKVPPASSSTTSGGSSSAAGGGAASGTESAPSADPEEGAKNHTVEMDDMVFSPETLEANVGDTVTFVNKEAAPHTATAEDKSWDSGNLNEGQEWTLELDKVGTIKYVCIYHPGMDGTLIVKPKGEEVAPASAGSDDAAATEGTMPASQIAGLSSGWLVLLAFLAGLQLQSRFSSRRKPEQVAPRPPGGYSA